MSPLSIRMFCLALVSCGTPRVPRIPPPPAESHPMVVRPAPPAVTARDPREAAIAAAVVQAIERHYLRPGAVDDKLSRTAFAAYLDVLDRQKLFLLRKDRELLAAHLETIDDELRAGSLGLARDGSRTLTSRVAVVAPMVASLLAAPLDHEDDEFVELDAKKIEPATTDVELRDRWRRRLELEVLERLAQLPAEHGAGATADDEASVRAALAAAYVRRFATLNVSDPIRAQTQLIEAVAAALDPHTIYVAAVAGSAEHDLAPGARLDGIGVTLLAHDGFMEVGELIPGGPAWRQGGLAPGDVILSAATEDAAAVSLVDMEPTSAVDLIRGPQGSVVRLGIEKVDGTQATVAITRGLITVADALLRGGIVTRKGKPAVGYLRVVDFQPSSDEDFAARLAQMKARRVAGIVIDLRGNRGGLIATARGMLSALIAQGPLVQTRSRDTTGALQAGGASVSFEGPIVVLVDRFTASAAEVFSAALQDYHRALIVGTGTTMGKGTGQLEIPLDHIGQPKFGLGALRVTTMQIFRVTGASTQNVGVSPDIALPEPLGPTGPGAARERELEHSIPYARIDALPHDSAVLTWNLGELAQRSSARVAKQPILSTIAAHAPAARVLKAETLMPLARSAWQARYKRLHEALARASPDLKKGRATFIVDLVATVTPPTTVASWANDTARDPWVEESVNIVDDMTRSAPKALLGR